MHEHRASFTAIAVAFARGLSGAGMNKTRDEMAETLLPEPYRSALRVGRSAVEKWPPLERGLSLASFDGIAHVSLRTAAIDEEVEAAISSGITQLVLVGAGLDARAHRLQSLRNARVFEVDHPATQRLKKARTEGHRAIAKELVYVPVDFGRDSLDEALERAGHDAKTPTLFVWEGVTMYLPEAATKQTLETLSKRAAPSSRIVVTYAEPEMSEHPSALRPLVRKIFDLLNEPLLGLMPRDRMRALLHEERFEVLRDSSSEDWERHSTFGEKPKLRLYERIAVATRSPS